MTYPPASSLHPAFPRLRHLILTFAAATLLSGADRAGVAAAPERRLEYNQDIRPILADACFHCHGPDSASRKADLRLDQRQGAIDLAAILPGDPGASELIRRIESDDEHEQMPPPETKKSLTAEQKQLLRRWIEQGAEYQPHWSFIPPQAPALPEVKQPDWVKNAIDRFILARLEAEGLTPAPEADRRTLARRVSLDLTGLPPAPEAVQAFVDDRSPDAYEKYVDQLLASLAWGEHRGRYWLDYARYADTHGYHFDNFREMWSYRDWVIAAFNQNMPYDQFTIENLAGDLLPGATLDQRIGSGFNRCNPTTNEGGIIDEEYLVLYTRDRVETTAQVWMGLTAGCAVCHSHKFDPLSQKEFYELAAFFNNTTQVAKDGNIKDTPPMIVVPRPEDRSLWAELEQAAAKLKPQLDARRETAEPEFQQWLLNAPPEVIAAQMPSADLQLLAPLNDPTSELVINGTAAPLPMGELKWAATKGEEQKALEIATGDEIALPDVGNFAVDQPFTFAAWVKIPDTAKGTIAGRVDNRDDKLAGWEVAVENKVVSLRLMHAPDAQLKANLRRKKAVTGKWMHLIVAYNGGKQSSSTSIYFNGVMNDDVTNLDRIEGSIENDVPFRIGRREKGNAIAGLQIRDVRLYNRVLAKHEIDTLATPSALTALLAKAPEERKPAEIDQLRDWYLPVVDEAYRDLAAEYEQINQEQTRLRFLGTIAHVMQEKPMMPVAFVLNRGEYDQRCDEVTPKTPEILPPFPEDLPKNRLGFATWLLRPEQPLTARVTVNRCWQEVFGNGLVKTAGDFGVMGDLPSHPELLDWLALEFRDNGWNLKQLYKMMVMSATYQQAAVTTPEKLEADPANRLLARGPRFRMDGEMVRDYALASSGILSPKIGGPSVRPYQPEGVWEAIAMKGSNTLGYGQGTGEDLYRRSLYTFVKRMAPPASLEIFNAPNREVCTIRRERTNTPLQALVTLNDTQFVEAARHLAQRALLEGGDTNVSRLQFIGQHLLARDFQPRELEIINQSLQQLQTAYVAAPEEAAKLIAYGESKPDPQLSATELAAWTMLVNQLMNLDEVLNK